MNHEITWEEREAFDAWKDVLGKRETSISSVTLGKM